MLVQFQEVIHTLPQNQLHCIEKKGNEWISCVVLLVKRKDSNTCRPLNLTHMMHKYSCEAEFFVSEDFDNN